MSSPPPTVSIGLAVFNGEEYLEEAIESFLGQTYQDFELLLADNASTDKTADICTAAAERDPRVHFLPSDANRGLGWNHNRVAAAARGAFFMWAPYDDRFAPDYIERCVGVLEADPGVVYCYGTTILTGPEGNILGREVPRFNLKSAAPDVRFWEQLIVKGGQNFYGLIRSSALRSIAPHRTFPWAERVDLQRAKPVRSVRRDRRPDVLPARASRSAVGDPRRPRPRGGGP